MGYTSYKQAALKYAELANTRMISEPVYEILRMFAAKRHMWNSDGRYHVAYDGRVIVKL